MALMVLTTVDKAQAPNEAKDLLSRAQTVPPAESRVIIDMVVTIISYRFGQITRQEVENMLDITFEETRVYQEVREDAIQEGLQKGRQEGRQEEAAGLVIRLLRKRFSGLNAETCAAISALPLAVLEDLSEALLDFSDMGELQNWLANHAND
ncbi:MAG: DUF4351 domain-containing protein [Cyanobacteria bacterium J06643_4]